MRSIRAPACVALAITVAVLIFPSAAAANTAYSLDPFASGDDPLPEPVREQVVEMSYRTPTPVLASWFGSGLYGNRTACGQVLTTTLVGVAHRTLPCGSTVTLSRGATTIVVPVVDRGPFIATREFDLTYAAKIALDCSDLCRLTWLR